MHHPSFSRLIRIGTKATPSRSVPNCLATALTLIVVMAGGSACSLRSRLQGTWEHVDAHPFVQRLAIGSGGKDRFLVSLYLPFCSTTVVEGFIRRGRLHLPASEAEIVLTGRKTAEIRFKGFPPQHLRKIKGGDFNCE